MAMAWEEVAVFLHGYFLLLMIKNSEYVVINIALQIPAGSTPQLVDTVVCLFSRLFSKLM